MELPVNTFKHALKAGKPQIGIWSSLSSHIVAEILSHSGIDWVLLDTEHSPNELPMVQQQLHAMQAGTAHPVVRVPWNDMVMIKRYLDIGPQSLLLPYVQSVEEAENAVRYTRYPQEGVRGVAGGSRAAGYGRIKDYHKKAAGELCLLVQVETRKAMASIEAAIRRREGARFHRPQRSVRRHGLSRQLAASRGVESHGRSARKIRRAGQGARHPRR
jgi:4-hydroxy-2-oxoheptanedioate aldolase